MVALAAIETALRRLAIPCGSLGRFSLSHSHDAAVEHLVFLQVSAAEAHEAVRESVLLNQLEERLLRSEDFHAVSLDVCDGARWVDGRVSVYRPKLDAAHPCKFEYHVAVLSSAVCHFGDCVAPCLLYQLHGSVNFPL